MSKRTEDLNEKIEELRKKEPAVIREFKEFINRGNVVDMAVGVIIGAAFGKIIASLVDNVLMPFIGLFIGGIDFSNFVIKIPSLFGGDPAILHIGIFIENVVDFIIIAFVIFIIVRAMNRISASADKVKAKEAKSTAKKEDENTKLLREIRDALVSKSKK